LTVCGAWTPANATEVVGAVNEALAADLSLELVGTASRRSLGRPVVADAVLDLSALNGIVVYEPEELVLVAAPGTPMADVRQALAQSDQHLAFEPPDFGPLWGGAEEAGTIGGAILTGRAGPRRLTAGGVRDHVLGVKAVNGFGEAFATGGRVMKNVTGFDLGKLVAGSFGTLCVVTELTLKVLPQPPNTLTLVVLGLDDHAALRTMQIAMNESSARVSSAAHLPADVAAASTLDRIAGPGSAATLLRIEGVGSSVASRLADLKRALGDAGPTVVLERDESDHAWAEISDGAFFVGGDSQVWRLSLPPAIGAVVGTCLRRELAGRHFYDWAGGAIWVETPKVIDAHATQIRRVLRELAGDDGHATLIRSAAEVRASIDPFQPRAPAVAALSERVRRQFDPAGIFNPGRMTEQV